MSVVVKESKEIFVVVMGDPKKEEEEEILVHENTANPTEVWEKMKETQNVMRFKVKTPREPPAQDKVRKNVHGVVKKQLFPACHAVTVPFLSELKLTHTEIDVDRRSCRQLFV